MGWREIYFDPEEFPGLDFLNDEPEEKIVKGKPVITTIEVSADRLHRLNQVLSRRFNERSKLYEIRKTMGGLCVICNAIPTKSVSYDVGQGAQLIEFYCEKCIVRMFDQLSPPPN